MSEAGFRELAAAEAPGLAGLLLAAAGEFRPVEQTRSRVELDRMAARLHRWVAEEGLDCAEAVAQLLAERRMRPSSSVGPEDAMLDRVIARGEGHPALIASVCIEAGTRAGLPLAPAGRDGELFVGIKAELRSGRPGTVIIDPTGALQESPHGLRWCCPHEVCFLALSELSRLFCLTGDVANALRAAELRAELPVGAAFRRRLAFEAGALRANLN